MLLSNDTLVSKAITNGAATMMAQPLLTKHTWMCVCSFLHVLDICGMYMVISSYSCFLRKMACCYSQYFAYLRGQQMQLQDGKPAGLQM